MGDGLTEDRAIESAISTGRVAFDALAEERRHLGVRRFKAVICESTVFFFRAAL